MKKIIKVAHPYSKIKMDLKQILQMKFIFEV